MSLRIWFPFRGNDPTENRGTHPRSQKVTIDLSSASLGTLTFPTITNYGVQMVGSGGKTSASCAQFLSGNYIEIPGGGFEGLGDILLIDTTYNGHFPIFYPEQKQLTIAFWAKTTETSNMCFFCGRTVVGEGISLFKLGSLFRFDAGEQTSFSCDLTYPNWTHFCFTWDGKVKRCYINGVENPDSPKACTANVVNYASTIRVGNSAENTNTNTNVNNQYIGYLNDYRIYDHCLSPREVKLLAQGLVAHYKLDDSGNFDPSRLSGITHSIAELNGATRCTWGNYFGYPCFKLEIDVASFSSWSGCWIDCIPADHGAQTGDVVTRSCKMYVPSGQTFPGSFGEVHERGGTRKSVKNYDRNKCDTWQTVSQTVELGTNNGGSSKLIHYFYAADKGYDPVKFTCYLRDFQLEYGTEVTEFTPLLPSNIEYDCSGYGNHGTKSAIFEASADSPRYFNSTVFKDNKYINCGRSAKVTDAITVSIWAYMDDWSQFGSSNMRLASCTESGGWNFEPNGDKICFACYAPGGNQYRNAIASITFVIVKRCYLKGFRGFQSKNYSISS